MSGVVYIINFPSGEFYIGSSYELHYRLRNHFYNPNENIKRVLDSNNFSLDDFLSFCEVVYEGDNYRIEEEFLIKSKKDDPLILNNIHVKKRFIVDLGRDAMFILDVFANDINETRSEAINKIVLDFLGSYKK